MLPIKRPLEVYPLIEPWQAELIWSHLAPPTSPKIHELRTRHEAFHATIHGDTDANPAGI
jgi:hypothetical protein